MMKFLAIIAAGLAFLIGCSGLNKAVEPEFEPIQANLHQTANHWNWGIWEFFISADHQSIEVVPARGADYHYCVTEFMEIWPCQLCLSIGPIEAQPDETIKFDVTLRHPFPNAPKYTGFDVRGMVYFPATQIQTTSEFTYDSRLDSTGAVFPLPYGNNMPIIFSTAEQGGGELLNADGFSCYLIPGLTYSDEWSIFSYSEPKNNIKPTPELTTINPYKLFCSDPERRMFLIISP